MQISEVIELFRARAHDESVPYLWQDEELLRYLVQAQDELVRRVGGIADVTVPLADIGSPQTRLQDLDLAVGNPYAAVSPYIIRFRRGRLLTAARDIQFKNQGDLDETWFDDYGVRSIDTLDDTVTGETRFALLDVRDGYVRWLYVPDEADTCRIYMLRLPYPRIATDQDALEIEDTHHEHLVEYMMGLAYLKPDEEIYDKTKSDAAMGRFEAYAEEARKEKGRKRFKPRRVHYGGIRW